MFPENFCFLGGRSFSSDMKPALSSGVLTPEVGWRVGFGIYEMGCKVNAFGLAVIRDRRKMQRLIGR
jgi:hypothetical protein